MTHAWTSRTETAMHAPFHQQPRNVERRGSPATSHVESRVSRDADIIPYCRYGVHNNAVLDSYVYYDPIVSTWFYRDRRERVDQDFLDDYFSDRQDELNYRGIYNPRVKFLNGQWVPNEIAAPSATMQESSTTLDSQLDMSNDVRVRERHTHRASKTTMEYAHENTSSHSKTSRRHRSSAARHEAPSSSSGRSMFEDMAKFFNEYPRRKNGGRHISSTPMHEAPKWGREETVVEKMVHRITDENRREDLTRSRTEVVHRTTERNAEEPQRQLLPKERQPPPSTMHSTDTAGMKGRTSAPDSTQSRQSRCEEGEQFRTLANVQETKAAEVAQAAQSPPRHPPQSSIAHRREELDLKGRETAPAARNRRVDTAEPTRRKAEQEVRPQQEALFHRALHEPTVAYTPQLRVEDVEGVRVSHDTLRRARDERDPRPEGTSGRRDAHARPLETSKNLAVEPARGSSMSSMLQTRGLADEKARRQRHGEREDERRRLHESRKGVVSGRQTSNDSDDEDYHRRRLQSNRDESHRLNETRKDVVGKRRSSNDSDDEDAHRRMLQPWSGESHHLHGRLEDLVVGRDAERVGAPGSEYRRTAERTTNDERSRRERREGKRDENARFLETPEKLVVDRDSETTGMASDERDAGCNPASDGNVERGGENVPVKPGRLVQDDQNSRHGERRPGDESVRLLEESVHLVVGQGVDPGGEYRQTTERRTNDERNRRVMEDRRRDENVRLLGTSENLVMERGGEMAGMASTERGAGYDPAPVRSGERKVGNVPTLTSRSEGAKGFSFALTENGISAAWMADLPPSQTILEGDVPSNQSPARSIARSDPSRGYPIPPPSRHPSVLDRSDRRRPTGAYESTVYSRGRQRLEEDVSRETRRIVSSQYSNASIGVYSPDTWGYRPQVHDHGLLQPPVTSSIVEIVDERGRNESDRGQDVAVQKRDACDTSHTQSRFVGPTRASLAASDAYWAKYSPIRAAGGKISPSATTEENEELEDVDDDNSSKAGYNSG